jgi:uncharacterized protein YnzC (UPF0291/DUF896 family)
MDRETVSHMLDLARRKRESTLSEQESLELAGLRQAYLADFRAGFRQQLDNIYVEQNDGSYEKLHHKTISPDEKETPDEV